MNSNKKQEHTTALVKKTKKRNENSDSSSSSSEENEEEETSRKKSLRPAREYKVTQIKGKSQTKTGLDLVILPIQETKRGKTSFLLDTGVTLTLIKLRNLKDETPVREERMVLTGAMGHKTHTIEKIRAAIPLEHRRIRHTIYVVKDDFDIRPRIRLSPNRDERERQK